jgi:hypothetical protein
MRSAADVMKIHLSEVVAHGNYALLDELAAEDMIDQTALEAVQRMGATIALPSA